MSIAPFGARPMSLRGSERSRTRLALAIATLGIGATLLAYAVSPGVRHAVNHAAHSVKGAVSGMLPLHHHHHHQPLFGPGPRSPGATHAHVRGAQHGAAGTSGPAVPRTRGARSQPVTRASGSAQGEASRASPSP